MESRPEISKPAWEPDSSDDSSDSDAEKDRASGSPEARAAPCMTIGAGVAPPPPADSTCMPVIALHQQMSMEQQGITLASELHVRVLRGRRKRAVTGAAGYLSTQGSLQSAAQLKAHSAAASGHAVWGRPLDGGSKTDEGDLARAALLALQVRRTPASCPTFSPYSHPHLAVT